MPIDACLREKQWLRDEWGVSEVWECSGGDQISGPGGFTWVDQGPLHVWSWLVAKGERTCKLLM